MKKKITAFILVIVCALCLLAGCTSFRTQAIEDSMIHQWQGSIMYEDAEGETVSEYELWLFEGGSGGNDVDNGTAYRYKALSKLGYLTDVTGGNYLYDDGLEYLGDYTYKIENEGITIYSGDEAYIQAGFAKLDSQVMKDAGITDETDDYIRSNNWITLYDFDFNDENHGECTYVLENKDASSLQIDDAYDDYLLEIRDEAINN